MFKKSLLLLGVCLTLSLSTAFAQEELPRPEPRESSPPPPPRIEPRQEAPRSEPRQESPRSEPRQEAPRREEPRREEPRERPNNDDSSRRRDNPRNENPADNRDRNRDRNPNPNPVDGGNRDRDRNPNPGDGGGRDRDNDGDKRRPPTNGGGGNGGNGGNNNNNGDDYWRRRQQEEDRRRREEEYRRQTQNTGIYYPYPYPNPNPSPSMRRYFDQKDVVYNTFDAYLEAIANRCLPYLQNPLPVNYEPLYPTYIREYFPNEFPFYSIGWAMYYETELDDFFIDFRTFGNHNFVKLVLTPIGEMAGKVAKKLGRKGYESNPTIVENLPTIQVDKIYSFSLSGLPKGDYELRLLADDCFVVRKVITVK